MKNSNTTTNGPPGRPLQGTHDPSRSAESIPFRQNGLPPRQGLYDPWFEHEACGVGFVVHVKGKKSHQIIQQTLQVLRNLDHRGACGCEANTGDGAGILMQVPHAFLQKQCEKLGFKLPKPGQYGAGLVFMPQDPPERQQCERVFERIVKEEGLKLIGWRTVPANNASLGATAKASEPFVRQVFIAGGRSLKDDMAFERKLYVIRKRSANSIPQLALLQARYWYVASLSYKTLVYKGMLLTEQVTRFYPDLNDPLMESALALVH